MPVANHLTPASVRALQEAVRLSPDAIGSVHAIVSRDTLVRMGLMDDEISALPLEEGCYLITNEE